MTFAQLVAEARHRLESAGIDSNEAALDARLLAQHVLGWDTARLLTRETEDAPVDVRDSFTALVARREAREPLAYITGQKEFWNLTFLVTPTVLVPRPETELLVERALARGPPGSARVADLGTGSGAVALALASERPQWQLVATDISAAALALARSNAAALGLSRVEFRLGDWFAPLAGDLFDLLVSNPPYVAAADPALALLRHEPQVALTPGADGLASLRTLAEGAAAHLALGGWLLLEHGAEQGAQVRAALVLAGFRHVRSHRDLAGHERMTEGQR